MDCFEMEYSYHSIHTFSLRIYLQEYNKLEGQQIYCAVSQLYMIPGNPLSLFHSFSQLRGRIFKGPFLRGAKTSDWDGEMSKRFAFWTLRKHFGENFLAQSALTTTKVWCNRCPVDTPVVWLFFLVWFDGEREKTRSIEPFVWTFLCLNYSIPFFKIGHELSDSILKELVKDTLSDVLDHRHRYFVKLGIACPKRKQVE